MVENVDRKLDANLDASSYCEDKFRFEANLIELKPRGRLTFYWRLLYKMKILTIVGARPQFIKAAVVSRSIASYNSNHREKIKEVIVHTGQHYDANMSDVFFKEMCIPEPDYNLGICDCSHGAMTGRMIEQIESVLLKEKPDVVLVYGDTNSTLAGALAAVKLHIPVAHVEAGLRSFNMRMPEEINRILTDRISNFLFCPTEKAVENLYHEGLGNGAASSGTAPLVVNVGDVMYDAVLYYRKIARPTDETARLTDKMGGNFYLATVHRAENTDEPERLRNIADAFEEIAKSTPIVLPLHPRTRRKIEEFGISLKGITVIPPVGYFDMLALLEGCRAVFTDSGGLQKEAYFFKKPCMTLRDETEWIELVEHGFNSLVGADLCRIVEAEKMMTFRNMSTAPLYGLGKAGPGIVYILNHDGTK
jgi:UDP-GlcNAc3NAcA epimerase